MSEPADESAPGDLRWRLRLAACSLVLVALAIVQRPGYLVGDTKLDLVVDPARFLGRALHLWDPQGAFGQVQNQAYGYLLPMGPWFLLGHALDVPEWLVQRLWLAIIMVVAFLGVVRLAGALGIGGPLSRVIAGFAFALSPRMITVLGPISIEALPSALAPWVLLPLVVGSKSGSARRAAALSALAVAAVGGVNAAATAAVLPLAVLWLLTRPAGPRRRQLLSWWPALTLLGTFWWLVPLFLLGRYSPPFLDFIENSSVTTLTGTLFDALRGTSAWVPYIEPGWQAGHDLIATSFLILNSGVVMLLGVVGLARRDLPHRRFLVLGVVVGLLLVTAGHLGSVQGWFADPLQVLLDGPLAPLRNIHKFDPVIRLPMVLGVAHVLDQLRLRGRAARAAGAGWRHRQPAALYAGVLSLSLVAVAGAAGPAWDGRLTPNGAFVSIPGYWRDAADWLAARQGPRRALLLPGSSFGTYIWGNPQDEPMQALARSPWAVRDAIPLTPPGTIRMLDAIESRLGDGRGSAGLAPYLRRAGISYLVVRNDLKRSGDIPDPLLLHQALEESPGITRVATFGPEVGGQTRLDRTRGPRVLVNFGWQSTFPAIEIYAVRGTAAAVEAPRALPVVIGGPENLLDLADHGLLGTTPTRLAVDAPRHIGSGPVVLTDGLRLRETTFGRVHDSSTYTLFPGEERRRHAPAREYELGTTSRWETQAELLGARSLTASSSMGDVTAPGALRREWMPWSAFDGDRRTQWVSAPDPGTPWVDLELTRARRVPFVRVTGGAALGTQTQLVRGVTERDTSKEYEVSAGQTVVVHLPPGATRQVRIEGRTGSRLALADVQVPSVHLARPLRMPRPRPGWPSPAAILMSSGDGARSGCVTVRSDVRCAPGRQQNPEEPFGLDRLVTLNADQDYSAEVTAAPLGGPALEDLIQRNEPVNISASSSAVPAPVSSGLAAIDGSIGTTWVADTLDPKPTLSLRWLGKATITGITLALDIDAAATPATSVTVTYPKGRQTVRLGRDGHAKLDPIRTDQLQVALRADDRAASLQFDGTSEPLGLGVSELHLDGLKLVPTAVGQDQRHYECGTGPQMVVNGVARRSALRASPMDLYLGRPVAARVCGGTGVFLHSGENRVRLVGSDVASGRALLLRRPGADLRPAPLGSVRVRAQSPEGQTLVRRTGWRPSTVVVHENYNPGWAAQDGQARATVADGWQQAWSVGPQQGRSLHVGFTPGSPYRAGLAAGIDTLLVLVVVALWRPRRHVPSPVSAVADAIPLRVMAPLAVVSAGLLAGWGGVVVAAVGFAVAALLARYLDDDAWSWVAGAPVALAALVYAWRPVMSPSGWAGTLALPQYLVLLSLVWVLTAETRRGGFIERSLMKGRSTKR